MLMVIHIPLVKNVSGSFTPTHRHTHGQHNQPLCSYLSELSPALVFKTPALLAHVRLLHTYTQPDQHAWQHVAPHPSSWRCNSGVVHQIPSIWSIQHFITLLYCHQSNGWQAQRLSCDMRHAGPCCDCWNMRKGTAIELDRFSYAELWVSSF